MSIYFKRTYGNGVDYASYQVDSGYKLLTNHDTQIGNNFYYSITLDENGKFVISGNVTNLFKGAMNKSFDVSNWVFDSEFTVFDNMFYGCRSLESIGPFPFSNAKPTTMNSMFYGCTKLKTASLSGFNGYTVSSTVSMFENCTSLTSANLPLIRGSTAESINLTLNANRMFAGCTSLADISSFTGADGVVQNDAKIGTADYMFYNCTSLTSADLSSFGFSMFESGKSMFENCTSLTSANVPIARTTSITSAAKSCYIDRMFYNCISLTDAGAATFCDGVTAPRIKTMSQLFYGCKSLVSPRINLPTNGVTDMHELFKNCTKLKNIDLTSFEVSGKINDPHTTTDTTSLGNQGQVGIGITNSGKVDTYDHTFGYDSGCKDFSGMFQNCYSLETVDISSFVPYRGENYNNMFNTCPNLEWIDAGDTDGADMGKGFSGQFLDRLRIPTSVTGTDMFKGCFKLVNFENTKLGIEKANSHHRDTSTSYPYGRWEDLGGNFKYHYKLYYKTDTLNCYFTNSPDDSSGTEYTGGATQAVGKGIMLNDPVVVLPKDCTNIFANARSFTTDDRIFDRLDTSHTKNMNRMFYSSDLDAIDTTHLNLRSLTNADEMFRDCTSLNSLDLGGFKKAPYLSNIQGLFYGCTNLTNISLTGINTSDVTRLDNLFRDCSKLTTIHLEECDFSKVTSVDSCFRDCPELTTIYVDPGTDGAAQGIGTAGITNNIFNNDTKLRNWPAGQTLFNAHDGDLDQYGYFTGIVPYVTNHKGVLPKSAYQKIDNAGKEVYIFSKDGGTWYYTYPISSVPDKLY